VIAATRAATCVALVLGLLACGDKKDSKPAPNVEGPATDPSQVREVVADEPVRLLGVGEKAPDFTREAHDGQTITLSQVKGPVVLYFYPKDETPG